LILNILAFGSVLFGYFKILKNEYSFRINSLEINLIYAYELKNT
jgi:hypothetical protein